MVPRREQGWHIYTKQNICQKLSQERKTYNNEQSIFQENIIIINLNVTNIRAPCMRAPNT